MRMSVLLLVISIVFSFGYDKNQRNTSFFVSNKKKLDAIYHNLEAIDMLVQNKYIDPPKFYQWIRKTGNLTEYL